MNRIGPRIDVKDRRESDQAFRSQVLDVLQIRLESPTFDALVKTFPTADAVVDRMLANLPTVNILDQKIGPFYDTAGLCAWKNVSRQAIHRQMSKRKILGLKTADNELIYPAWQFGTDGRPLPNLDVVLNSMDPNGVDLWGDALWLRTPAEQLGGLSPAELLRAGQLETVLAVAHRIGRALAS